MEELKKLSLAELEKILEDLDAKHIAGEAFDRKYARAVMAERNHKIHQQEADHFGLTSEEYAAVVRTGEESNRVEMKIDEVEVKIRRAELNRAIDPDGTDKRVNDLKIQLDGLHKELANKQATHVPLHTRLRHATRDALKAARAEKGQTVVAQPVTIGVEAKSA